MTVKKFTKKMSKENQPLPQTIIKDCLSIFLRTAQNDSLNIVFLSLLYTIALTARLIAAPL